MLKRKMPNRSLLIASLILTLIGAGGVALIITATLPTVGPRWLFFFFLSAGTTGVSLPFVWYLHQRFGRGPTTPQQTLLRQGLWSGFFLTISIWLQINRSLNLPIIIILMAAIAAVEWLLQFVRQPRRKRR